MSKDSIQDLVLATLDEAPDSQVSNSEALKLAGGPVDQAELLGVLKSLESRQIVTYDPIVQERLVLTEEGAEIADNGSHEARVFNAIVEGAAGSEIPAIKAAVGPAYNFGQGAAFKKKWIQKTKEGNIARAVGTLAHRFSIPFF
ncbi:hypothetical protein BDK51DRAFT_44388 [Blyttiomyces helicus]|uniref:PheRS DNA binding domain-containing protein n=1 Tax=Blyttiomyces helicus TaxID=388810 RepID=A0A4P9WE85_9FUNG|nr:hypothetical protein BDK51DRAFT_44388 [Blyttiomyces helicus]|eukprot:RKO91029.1 hypothetical protein BDK51DRAFT_44388 [Blyttiomyces helicus]